MFQNDKSLKAVHRSNENDLHRSAYNALGHILQRAEKKTRRELCSIFRGAFGARQRAAILDPNILAKTRTAWRQWGEKLREHVQQNSDRLRYDHLRVFVQQHGHPQVE